MTIFPPFPARSNDASERRSPRSERYSFQVAEKHYTLQFWPMTYSEGYNDGQAAALGATAAYEVSFRLEDYTLPDGTILAGYDTLGTGEAFQVLGGVANGIAEWTKARRPTFLYWLAQGARRQRLYDRIIRCFAARGSGWHRLLVDPFTGSLCPPEVFWLGPKLPDGAQPSCSGQL